MLDKMLRMGTLLDVHGSLLTEHQRQMCVLYYLNDYSLAEISELYGVSRQAVHDTLARAERAMEGHEEAFGLVREAERRRMRLNELDSILSEASLTLKRALAHLTCADRSGQSCDDAELDSVREGLKNASGIIDSARELVASFDADDDSVLDLGDEDDERRGGA